MNSFTHQLLAAGFLATLALPAAAQVQSRTAPKKAAQTSAMSFAQSAQTKGQFQLLSVTKEESTLPYSEYGEVVDIINEDFSKMTTGSVDAPDTNTDINYENTENAWINMSGDYTQVFGWGSHGAYPAGGYLYLEEGQVNTPMLNVSGYSPMAIIRFDAFTNSTEQSATYVGIEAAETFNMSPSWDILGSSRLPEVTNEKQTYTFAFYGGGATTLFNIYNYSSVGIFVDNVHVYVIDQPVGTPTEGSHRYYQGSEFNLIWDKAKNAESYLIDLYQLDDEGNPTKYVMQDFDTETNDTTMNVEGAESGATYYFTVRGKLGDKVSIPSEVFEIYDVASPVMNAIETPADGKFTASWEKVPSAERYNYQALYKRTAEQDGEFTLTNLVFPGMKYNEGSLDNDGNQLEPTYTVKDPDYHTLDLGVLQNADQAGWTARHYAVYKDALAIDGYFYYYSGDICSLESPEFDLSKNNGQFTVDTRLCSENVLWYNDLGQSYYVNPRSMIALFNYDEETDDFVQTESWYVSDLTNDWQDYTHTFTMGSDRSILSVFSVYAPGNIYLDHLKLTQDYKQGESFLDPFYFANFVDGTSVDVPVSSYQKVDGADIYHQAQAVRTPTEQDQYASSYKRVYSDWSEPVLAANNINGVQQLSLNSTKHASLMVQGDNIVVNNPKGEAVSVYGINGTQIFSNASGDASVSVPMPQHGSYIVKVGKQTIKFVL